MKPFFSLCISMTGILTNTAYATEIVNYTYDARGRVIKVEHSGNVNSGVKIEYMIDKAENRSNVKVTGTAS